MKKKILSMLLSMVLTVACFTGCGSNPSSGGETGGAASTETPKNPEDMYTVTMAVIGNDQEDMDLVEAEMNKILAEKVGAQIDVITLGWGVYQQQLQLMLSGAEKLDLVPIMYNNVSTYVNSGQVLDMSDLKVKWKYYKEDNTDYVTAEFDDEPGKIKLIFKVEDYPELYDVLLNGKSNEELYEGFNSRLFDKEEGSIEKSELGESQDSLDDTVTENESVDSQDIDLSLEEDPDVWFITYNSFYRTRDIGGIEINVMNDAVMFVQCTGSDGTVAE